MDFKSFSLSVLAGAVSLVSFACAAPGGERTGQSSAAVSIDETPYISCVTDFDCVAVPQAGCCNNGYLAAVAVGQVCAYDTANECQQTNPICPMFKVLDTRIPQCGASGQCTMVQPPPPVVVIPMGSACGAPGTVCDDSSTCLQDDPNCDPAADGGACASTCQCD